VPNNKVLVRIVQKNVDRRTKGGIYLISPTDTSWQPDVHADRWGKVVQVPSHLKTEKNHLWTTTCELQIGDLVWWDMMISESADTIITPTYTYLLLDYFCLHVAKSDNKITPINGYQMFTLVSDESTSPLAIKTGRSDARYGVLKHKGSLNKYLFDGCNDDERIQVGDKCVFKLPPIMLEAEYHAVFGEKLRISQLYNISAFIHSGVLNASINHVVIEPVIGTHSGGIEIPLPFRKPTGIGTIYDVHCPDTELKKGMEVCYFAETATTIEFEGRKLQVCHKDYIKFYKP
jgi:co-chaperonin GroES (HSP10)